MRLILLLSFYDEPVEDLVACITTAAEAGVTHVVAVDGAYALFPEGKAASPAKQHAAIVLVCRELGVGLTLHVPATVWAGNEVEKRCFHFRLAHAVSRPGDWFWILDADEVVIRVPEDLKDRLAATEHDAAEVQALDVVALRAQQKDWPPYFPVRHMFRAQPITVRTNHITFLADDGRLLSGYENGEVPLEDALDLTEDVLIEHRPDRRPLDRLLAKQVYYTDRNVTRAERGTCHVCAAAATQLIPMRWRMTEIGPVADWMEACDECAVMADKVNRMVLTDLGIDPESVEIENRNGRAPAAIGRASEG